jgi:hypothetical protein
VLTAAAGVLGQARDELERLIRASLSRCSKVRSWAATCRLRKLACDPKAVIRCRAGRSFDFVAASEAALRAFLIAKNLLPRHPLLPGAPRAKGFHTDLKVATMR